MSVLSRAEQEVFFLALTNMTSSGIAQELNLSQSGVRFHLTNIFKKTNTKTRVELLSNFVETTKTDQNVLLFIFQMKKELDEIKAKIETILPSGRSLEQSA